MRALALSAILALLAPAAGAGERFRLLLNGTWAATEIGVDESRTVTEFAEDGRLDAGYTNEAGPGLDAGLEFLLFKKVGVHAAYATASRDGSATWDASLPHPFFFNRPRQASGETSGLGYEESVFHLDAVVVGGSGAIELGAFAGVSFFSVDADLIENVSYSHSYPYDTVTVTTVATRGFSDSPTGFNVGGRLDYRFGQTRRFGLGLLLRYSQAKAKLSPSAGNTVELDAGGFAAGLGLRVVF